MHSGAVQSFPPLPCGARGSRFLLRPQADWESCSRDGEGASRRQELAARPSPCVTRARSAQSDALAAALTAYRVQGLGTPCHRLRLHLRRAPKRRDPCGCRSALHSIGRHESERNGGSMCAPRAAAHLLCEEGEQALLSGAEVDLFLPGVGRAKDAVRCYRCGAKEDGVDEHRACDTGASMAPLRHPTSHALRVAAPIPLMACVSDACHDCGLTGLISHVPTEVRKKTTSTVREERPTIFWLGVTGVPLIICEQPWQAPC
eukprot:scaffold306_cov525-Prasinococcus_capsulatus_cf.AAC.38